MSQIQYTTFVKNEFQMFSGFLALRSLQVLDYCEKPPIVLIPKPLAEELEVKYPKLKVQNMIRKLGGVTKDGFNNGFNPRNSFRASLGNLARKVGPEPMIYFAPTTLFFKNPESELMIADYVAARAPDQYWPVTELYGPKAEAIWGEIAKFVSADVDAWLNPDFAKEYWRRYPCASTQLIYMKNAIEFSEANAQISKGLLDANLHVLQGQGRNLVEATIAATIMSLQGKIADINWDGSVVAFDNFPQLVLRMREEHRDQFNLEILDFQGIRSVLKKIHEYKIALYHNSVPNVRGKLDEVEAHFSLLRMNVLIERRKIDKKVKSLIREAKKAEAEAASEEKSKAKIDKLAEKLAAKDANLDAL